MPSPFAPRPLAPAHAVFMVRPASFGFNTETAASNRFQQAASQGPEAVAARARAEFDAMVAQLEHAGVQVLALEDSPLPAKPDAVFPNNWVSFHADGTIVLYPMQAPNRRLERRMDLVEAVCERKGFRRRRLVDLSHHEAAGRFLEGTGSLVLDHDARVAYACRSPRTDESVLREWAEAMHFEALVFDSNDAEGAPYYHTNVMLAIGSRVAVVALTSLAPRERGIVSERLQAGGKRLIDIDAEQVIRFGGNMLELQAAPGGAMAGAAAGTARRLWALSSIAHAAFRPDQLEVLHDSVDALLPLSIPTIEMVGGGSVRCTLAEVPDTGP